MTARPTPSRSAQGVKFHNGDPLTAEDVAKSLQMIAFPPEGVLSPRSSDFEMVDKIEAPDPRPSSSVSNLRPSAFLPALADPYAFIYQKKVLEKDPHWYETNILGSGPFKFASYETGQSISGVRNPDYYHQGQALSRRDRRHLCAEAGDADRRACAATAPPSSSAACRRPRATI